MTVSIRPWKPDDLVSLTAYANNIKVWNQLRNFFPYPYTESNARAWLQSVADVSPATAMAVDLEGEAIGGISIGLNSDVYVLSAELSYWLGEPFWGKGYATEAVGLMTEYAFSHFTIVRLYAEVFENNKASMKVLEKNDYVLEGIHRKAILKNNILMDDYIWARLQRTNEIPDNTQNT